jgi:ABC-type polysaccharide/polyol phosphate export systems, permease component
MDKRKKNVQKRKIEKKSEVEIRRRVAKNKAKSVANRDEKKSKKSADEQRKPAKEKAKAIVDAKVSDKKEKFNQYKFVIKELTAREIKRKYSRSVLGIVWSVLNPLLSMAIISLIFSQIFRRSIVNFPIYYLSGSLLWQLFTGATTAAMTTFVDNKTMLIKVKLPMQIFVLARVYTALVNLEYSLVAYVVMLFVFQVKLTFTMLFTPFIIVFLLLFSLGISYMVATAYVFFGDIKHLYSVFLTLLMYCSALFYPVDQLSGIMHAIVTNNPVFSYIDALRSVVMLGELPTLSGMLRMVFWGVAMYALGYRIFKKNQNTIMQKI